MASAAIALLFVAGASAGTLPTGFQDETVIETNEPGLEHPTTLKFAPDGRMFVGLKGGKILDYAPGSTTPTVFANLAKPTYDNGDHGLLGLALDPKFEEGRPYVYALYTFNHELGKPLGNPFVPRYPSSGAGVSAFEGDECPPIDENKCVVSGRLVKLTAQGEHAAPSAAAPQETVLLEEWCQQSSSHSIGDLEFGPEENLFVSGGEGGIFTNPDYGQYENLCGDPNRPRGTSMPSPAEDPNAEGGALRSQSIFRPNGEVLLSGTLDRIDPDTGEGVPGNPFYGDANKNKARIVANGFRNPFRFTISPRLNDVFLGNVGANTWEEIDRIPIGDPSLYNSGWPCYEGLGRNFEFEVLGLNACKRLYETPNSTELPFFYYKHGTPVVPGDNPNECPDNAGSAIAGEAFYEGTNYYPEKYDDALFFADAVRGCIYVMLADHEGGNELRLDPSTVEPFLSEGTTYPGVDLVQGPEHSIFYVSLYGGPNGEGLIGKIAYDPGAPAAKLKTVGHPWGPASAPFEFDASESISPGGNPLKYEWDLNGDGKFEEGSDSPHQTFTYNKTAKVTVSVRVEDTVTHKSSIARETVFPGDSPPKITITEPSPSLTWKVGEPLHFAGKAFAQEGKGAELPAEDLYWKTRLLHCPEEASACHEHPIQIFPATKEGTVGAPDHEFPSFVNFILTATDSLGLSAETSVKVEARPVALQIDSKPPGIQMGVGESFLTTPAQFLAIEESRTQVAAPETAQVGGVSYTFERWCDGGARVHEVPTNGPGTYTAIFRGPNGPAGSCDGGGGGGGGGGTGGGSSGGGTPTPPGPPAPGPVAKPKLKKRPAKKTGSTTAKFVFSGPVGSTFRCKIDKKAFVGCRSPQTYKKLKRGTHTVKIYAQQGSARSAATVWTWKILGSKPKQKN